ncbi:hypothetical protein N7510_008498 [Penicillium lagena]|uniref:uncharacterized protein n=1 Tax=Penicillium lagena TaxID=94218 RepID=UPI0025422ECD|nr:uncharacterized protein N7510_008498 [Penicillium lagena]KAJ5605717.1 hypothetical protein N7510_008498 [Penicillium lagena]
MLTRMERPDMLTRMDYDHITPQNHFTDEPQFWARYGSGPGVAVTGWPSQGGIYTLQVCSRVELEFLELDLFNNTLRPSASNPEWQNKENAHCDRMRRLGPTWWKSEYARFYSGMLEISEGRDNGKDNYIRAGWPPGGGVWVLQTTRDEASEKGLAKLQNANTMQERCELIEKSGGVFYEDPKACPYLDLP